MTSVFWTNSEFSIATHGGLLKQNYRLMREMFPDREIEFFYYIKPSETVSFFIVRVREVQAEAFGGAMLAFAENMCFRLLSSPEAKEFFSRTPKLDEYV